MKDPEFLELLNLYLDREISEADAARLEAEVTADPKRRRVYLDYCRMNKACAILGDLDAEAAPPRRRIVPSRRSALSTGWYAAGALAAACIVAIFVYRGQPAGQQAPVQVASAPVPAARPAASFTAPAVPTLVAAPVSQADSADQFAWMNSVKLEPMQDVRIERAMFQPTPVLIDLDNRAIRQPAGMQTTAERAAFQFQR
jgi:hypothetical protein